MRLLVTGASGFIGSALVPTLERAGHTVVRLVRREPLRADEMQWDAGAGRIDLRGAAPLDGAVHLAGQSIGSHRWNATVKAAILDSRVAGTRLLTRALAELDPLPQVLVNGSAIGYYGNRGDEILTEASAPGTGFLSSVAQAWEAAAAPAQDAGIRTVFVRTGIVIGPGGGTLSRMLPLFKLGLGGKLGRGDQWFSWISLTDEVAAICRALEDGGLRGPLNATAPTPVTNAELTRELAAALHRPAFLRVPATVLRLALGREMADELLLSGQRVQPKALQDAGFAFSHPRLSDALAGAVSGR